MAEGQRLESAPSAQRVSSVGTERNANVARLVPSANAMDRASARDVRGTRSLHLAPRLVPDVLETKYPTRISQNASLASQGTKLVKTKDVSLARLGSTVRMVRSAFAVRATQFLKGKQVNAHHVKKGKGLTYERRNA